MSGHPTASTLRRLRSMARFSSGPRLRRKPSIASSIQTGSALRRLLGTTRATRLHGPVRLLYPLMVIVYLVINMFSKAGYLVVVLKLIISCAIFDLFQQITTAAFRFGRTSSCRGRAPMQLPASQPPSPRSLRSLLPRSSHSLMMTMMTSTLLPCAVDSRRSSRLQQRHRSRKCRSRVRLQTIKLACMYYYIIHEADRCTSEQPASMPKKPFTLTSKPANDDETTRFEVRLSDELAPFNNNA